MKNLCPGFKRNTFKTTRDFSFLILAGILFLLSGFLPGGRLSAQITQTFNASGTFTAPAGVTSVTVQAWGAGGGGGTTTSGRGKGGGGGGAYASSVFVVIGGNSYTVTVGTGGAPGVNGGNSSFNGTSVVAAGGSSASGTTGGTGGTTAASTGTTKFAGGDGGTADGTNNHGGGGGGGSAFTIANGNSGGAGNILAGAGGTGTGAGGSGGSNNGSGSNGNAPGGGGGGRGDAGAASGSGADGRVTITYTCLVYAFLNTTVNSAVCQGGTATINLTSLFAVLPTGTYTVTYNLGAPNAATGLTATMVVTTAGTGSFTTTTLANSGSTAITITNLSSAGCGNVIGLNNTATITVNPLPTVNSVSNQTICNTSSTAAINFTGSLAGTVYNWTNNNPTIGLAASGSGNIAAFTATNTGTAAVSATITVTPSYTNGGTTCAGTATSFTITVNPTPTVNAISNQTVCNNGSTNSISFSGAITGTVFNWTNSNPSIGLAASGSGNIAAFTAINTGTTAATATITVTPSYTNGGTTCTGTATSFTITVNPTPTVNAVSNMTVCNGTTTVANFSGAVSGTVYNWTNNNTAIGLAASGNGNISFTATNGGTSAISATITVTPSYTNGGTTCTGTSTSFTIVVNPTPTVNSVSDQTLCNNSSTAAINFSGAVTGTVYNWTNNNTSIGLSASGSGNIPSFTATNGGTSAVTATITVTPSYTNGGTTCTGSAKTFAITVNPTPTVNALGNQTVCNGSSTSLVSFSGAVAGTVYSWINNTPSIGLAASGTGDIPSFTVVNNGSAAVTATIIVTPSFTNGGTTCAGTSTTFTITVNPTPQGSLSANGPFCTSGTAQLIFTSTSGTGPFTVVYNDGSSNQTVNNITSGISFNVGVINATTTYTLVSVSDLNNCQRNNGFTNASAPVVVYAPPVITAQPTSMHVCATDTVYFSVSATGDGLTYQWYFNGSLLSDGGFISGSATSTLSIYSADTTNRGAYYCKVSGTAPCTSVNSNTVALVVDQETVITSQPSSVQTCAGTTATFTCSVTGFSTGGGLIFQWKKGSTNLVNGGNISGATSSTLTLTNIAASDAGNYRVVITNPLGNCATVRSNFATLTVDPVSSGGTLSSDITVCSGSSGSLSVSGQTGNIVRWEYSVNGGSSWTDISNTTTSQAYTNITTTTQYRVLVQNSNCSGAYSNVVTVTINPTPVGTASPSNQNVCSGSTITTITFSGNLSNMAYSWTRDQLVNVSGLTSGTGNISGTLTNNTNSQQRVIFTITPTDTIATGICTGTIFYDTVYVNPTPTVTANPSTFQSVCTSGSQSTGNFSSITIKNPNNVSGSTWSWTRDNTTNITGIASSGSGTSFNGTIGSVALTNNTSTIQQTIFTIKAISPAGCFSTVYDTIQVNPEISQNEIFVKTVCVINADSVNIVVKDASTLAGGNGAYSYQWYERHPQGNAYSIIAAPRGVKQTLNYSTGSENYFFERDVFSGGCKLTSNEAHVNTIGNGSITNADDDSIAPHVPTSYCTGGSGVLIGTNNSILSDTSNGFQIMYVLYKDNVAVDTVFGTGTALSFGYFTQAGTYKVKVIIGVPNQTQCSPIPLAGSLKLTIDTLATTANAGPNQNLCAVSNTTLNGNSPGTSIGTWSVVSGTGTISNINSATTGITGLSSGSNVFRWTMTNGACSNYSDVIVTVNSPNVAATSIAATTPICSGSSTTLTQTGGSLGTGATWKWYSDASYTTLVGTGSGSNASLTVSPTLTTTYYLRAEGAKSPCTANTNSGSKIITVNQANIAASSLNAATPICNGSNTTLTQTGGSLGTGAAWKWYSDASYTTLVGTGSGSNANLTVSPAVTTTYYLRAEGATAPCTAITPSGNIAIAVNARPTSVITGSDIQCKGSVTPIIATFTGSGPWSITYSDGATSSTINNISSNPYTFTVSPLSTTTYTISAMNDAACASQAADRTGSVIVTVPNGAVGVWTGAVDNDWFNCRNWAIGSVPTSTDSASVPPTIKSPRIDQTSVYASGYARCNKLSITNNTLYFAGPSDSLLSMGNILIQGGGKIDMTAGGRLEVRGNWSNQVTAGFVPGLGTVVFSGSNTQTLSSINNPETFYNLQINKTLSSQQLNLLSNVKINHDLTLTKGIITTDNNLLTWDRSGGGTLTAPNVPWSLGQSNSSNSYICTCTSSGNQLSFTTPYSGNFGFKILSVGGNSDIYFPVGADLVSANRMSLNMNNLVTRDFSVIVSKGDIGNTIDPRVNRIWYVKASDTTGVRATMKLFFTKRTNFIQWPAPEDEIEPPFPYAQVRLIQKNYGATYFINQSTGADIQSGWAGASFGTEVYALYTQGISQAFDLSKNGISQFNEFSIIDGSDIVLPVTITNIRAWLDGAVIRIGWISTEETNIDHYEIEKSLDAQHFNWIGGVTAKNSLRSDYVFTDDHPITGNNFYRIKIIDKNGSIGYSTISTVAIGKGIVKIILYPNPVLKHIFNLQLNNATAGNYQLQVYDGAGRIVLKSNIEHFGGSSTQQLILPAGVATGAYRVVLLNNSKTIYKSTLIVAD